MRFLCINTQSLNRLFRVVLHVEAAGSEICAHKQSISNKLDFRDGVKTIFGLCWCRKGGTVGLCFKFLQ